MCTVILLSRPGHRFPVLIAANRDEMNGRAWQAPGFHWPSRPGIIGGLDELAGGTWLAANQSGLVAAMLNRPDSLGPAAGKKSRGELPLMALEADDLATAVGRIVSINGRDYRSFNMVIAAPDGAVWVRFAGDEPDGHPTAHAIPDGLHMLTAYDLDDAASARIRRHLPLFRDAAAPDPEAGDWSAWIERMADRGRESGSGENGAMTIGGDTGFGTVSSSLMALKDQKTAPIWLFAGGQPDKVSFDHIVTHTTDCV